MSAGRPGSPSSEPPDNSLHAVNKFGVADRLHWLAPLHRQAAMQRAAREAGHPAGRALPTLTDIATAEAPPPIRWTTVTAGTVPPRTPTRAERAAAADEVMRDVVWRATQPLMPTRDLAAAARREAEDRVERVRQAALADPVRVVEMPEPASLSAHESGMALARRHGPLLVRTSPLNLVNRAAFRRFRENL